MLEAYSAASDSTVSRFIVENGVITSDELTAGGLRIWLTGHDPVTGEERGHQRLNPDADLLLDGTLNHPKSYSVAALLHPELATEFEALQDRLRGRILLTWQSELNARRGHGGLIREDITRIDEALSTASKRILLVSPWVKSAVVNADFMGALERALRRGVQVDIAHGIGEDDRGSDGFALSRLANLQRRYQDKLRVTRHPNTHAKILIFDDVWVATSFNWLSFRGDADRTYRMEEGTLVRSSVHADREYLKYKELLSSI